jgi:hypothetical protein
METDSFAGDVKRLGLSDDERHRITLIIANDPMAGELMPGTGGARKLRIAKEGKGKRGGYRVVTYFAADDVPVFLLAIFDKGEKIDLTQAEKNELRKELSGVADDYRQSMSQTVSSLKGRVS